MSLISILNEKRDKAFSKALLDNVKTAHKLKEIISNFYVIDSVSSVESKERLQHEMTWDKSFLHFFAIQADEMSCKVIFVVHYASDAYTHSTLQTKFGTHLCKNKNDGNNVVIFEVTDSDLDNNDKLMEKIATAFEFFKCKFKMQSNKHDIITMLQKI